MFLIRILITIAILSKLNIYGYAADISVDKKVTTSKGVSEADKVNVPISFGASKPLFSGELPSRVPNSIFFHQYEQYHRLYVPVHGLEARDIILTRVGLDFVFMAFSKDGCKELGKYLIPKRDTTHGFWTAGDCDNDGKDEIFVGVDKTLYIYKWINNRFSENKIVFKFPIRDLVVGDIDQDGKNEVVISWFDKMESDLITGSAERYLLVGRYQKNTIQILWRDAQKEFKFNNGEMIPADLLKYIADYDNDGKNELIINHTRSDVGPQYNYIFTWIRDNLSIKDHFSIVRYKINRMKEELNLGCPFVASEIYLTKRNGRNLFYVMSENMNSEFCFELIGIGKDNVELFERYPIGREWPEQMMVANVDGKGEGLLTVFPNAGPLLFRFYRKK